MSFSRIKYIIVFSTRTWCASTTPPTNITDLGKNKEKRAYSDIIGKIIVLYISTLHFKNDLYLNPLGSNLPLTFHDQVALSINQGAHHSKSETCLFANSSFKTWNYPRAKSVNQWTKLLSPSIHAFREAFLEGGAWEHLFDTLAFGSFSVELHFFTHFIPPWSG